MNKFSVVLRKELREAFRDRRALGVLLLIVVIYPMMLWVALHKIIDLAVKGEHENISLVVIGAPQVPTLVSLLEQKNIKVTARDDMNENDITELLSQREVMAVIKVGSKFTDSYNNMRPARIEFWFDSANDQPSKLRRVETVLHNYNAMIASSRLLAHGVSPAALTPIQLQSYDTATNASRSVQFLGALLGIFFAASFFFCLNTAMDTTAGERERRSLEILLAQPIPSLQLIMGKWLATASLAIIGLTLELTVAHLILIFMPLEEIGMSWRMSWPMLYGMTACAIPLCLFAAAFEIALAMNAKTFKEAQTMMSFAVILPMIPTIVVPMLDLNTATWMYAVPVLANQTLLLETAKGQTIGILPYVLTIGSSMAAALLAIGFAAWRLKSEKYVLGV
ncbi:MAG: ABC transporter permease [Burkholderiaceae bacterium]|nr:ABC transporter permease [Burkholderiaceae bacterium]